MRSALPLTSSAYGRRGSRVPPPARRRLPGLASREHDPVPWLVGRPPYSKGGSAEVEDVAGLRRDLGAAAIVVEFAGRRAHREPPRGDPAKDELAVAAERAREVQPNTEARTSTTSVSSGARTRTRIRPPTRAFTATGSGPKPRSVSST